MEMPRRSFGSGGLGLIFTAMIFLASGAPAQTPGTKLWELGGLGNPYGAPPAVAQDGTVYVLGWYGAGRPYDSTTLWAIRAGAVVWAVTVQTTGLATGPAVGRNGTVYVAGQDEVQAYSPEGTLRWSQRFESTQRISPARGPALGPDGTLYVVGSALPGSGLYAFEPGGILKWRFTPSGLGDGISTPVVAGDGTVYVQADKYYALTPEGTVKWALDLPAWEAGSTWGAIGRDGEIYVVGSIFPSKLFCINPDGALRWQAAIGSDYSQQASAPAIGPDGTIYVADSHQVALEAFRPDGSRKWVFAPPPRFGGRDPCPAVGEDGTVYAGLGGSFYAVNPDGRLLWQFPQNMGSFTAAAITPDGTVYVGNAADTLYAFKVTAGPARSPWPMFQRNPQRTGRANVPPVATDDSVMALPGSAIRINVLANDRDPDGDPLSVTSATEPTHGSVTINNDQTVTYTPAAGYFGADHFRYTIQDGLGGTASAAVSINNHAPDCMLQLPCELVFPEDPGIYLIAPDNSAVWVTLDGSGSSDPDRDPLQFWWFVDGTSVSAHSIDRERLALGRHTISLVVSDGWLTNRCEASVAVITPGEAIGHGISILDAANLNRENRRALRGILEAAAASFDRGNLRPGIRQLQAFQRQVLAQVARRDATLAQTLVEVARRIIESAECAALQEGGRPDRPDSRSVVPLPRQPTRHTTHAETATAVWWTQEGPTARQPLVRPSPPPDAGGPDAGPDICFHDQVLISGPSLLGLTVADDGTIYYADYFGGEVGILDQQGLRLLPLRSGLKHPYAIEAFGTKVFFTEAGTDSGGYHDGTLAVYDTANQSWATLRDDLHYPRSLFITPAGQVYVVEGGGSATVFGGHDRLIRFPPGSGEYEVVLAHVQTPAAVVVDSAGTIFVASWGSVSPGDTGQLFAYRPGSTTAETVVTGLPAVWDMIIDSRDDIYFSGFGEDNGPMVGIGLVPKNSQVFFPVKTGVQVWCLARDRAGDIFYSTGRSDRSVRVLRACAPNLPPIADASATPTFSVSPDDRSATVMLDGSRSSDPENDPLAFAWLENGIPIANGAVARATLPVGIHTITLQVSDGHAQATQSVAIQIVTVCQALGSMEERIRSAVLPRNPAPLLAALRNACKAFEANQVEVASRHLSHFLDQATDQLSRARPALLSELLQMARAIQEALGVTETPGLREANLPLRLHEAPTQATAE